jgi:hypothetical protein
MGTKRLYNYANNNPAVNIDWMGLTSYTTTNQSEIKNLFSHLTTNGTLEGFNFKGWTLVTDEDLWYIDDFLEAFIWITGGVGGQGISGNMRDGFVLPDVTVTAHKASLNVINFGLMERLMNLPVPMMSVGYGHSGSSAKYYDQEYGETFVGGMGPGLESTARHWGGFNDLGETMSYNFAKGGATIAEWAYDLSKRVGPLITGFFGDSYSIKPIMISTHVIATGCNMGPDGIEYNYDTLSIRVIDSIGGEIYIMDYEYYKDKYK